MSSGPVVCPGVCAAPATVTLEPGQTVDIPWDGRFGVDFMLPQQCSLGGASSNLACVRAQRIEANIATVVEGKPEVGILPTGQVVGVVEELPSVAELLERIEREAEETLARLTTTVGRVHDRLGA